MDLARGRGPWLLAWLAVAPIVALRAGTLAESDTFWQTRTGELILDLGRLPTADPFSWTAAGHPWTVNSWGFDVLLAWAYRSGGLPGVALAGAVLAFLAAGLVLLVARRLGAGPLAATVVVQGAALALLTFLSVRPQLVDYCVIPVLVLLTRGVTRPAAQLPARLVGLGALATAWVNLHSTAVMGVPLLAAAAVATAVWRPAALGRVGAALAVYTLGVMVNPAGPQILTQAVTVARESTGVITETPCSSRWSPSPRWARWSGPGCCRWRCCWPPPFFPRPGSRAWCCPSDRAGPRCQRSSRSSSRGAAGGSSPSRSRWPWSAPCSPAGSPPGSGGRTRRPTRPRP